MTIEECPYRGLLREGRSDVSTRSPYAPKLWNLTDSQEPEETKLFAW
jgi:hypothetical protein